MKLLTILIITGIITTIVISGCLGSPAKSPDQQTVQTVPPTTIAVTVTTPMTVLATTPPTPTPEPYPTALKLKQGYNFSSGKTASEATVYRFWINDTYQLFDPRETRYVTKYPSAGNKYLVVFVNIVDKGTARQIPPKASNIAVRYNDGIYYMDPTHVLPKTERNVDAPPEIIRIGEIEFFHTLNGDKYVEDFGYRDGYEQAYVTPGISNAIDGYIIYEVPASLAPGNTYVEIGLNSQESAIWKLAEN
ncbi:MAG: hypothetical protein OS112_07965 [Methanoregula sp.]|nr:MAG: hypothetical protein OS112_07965 [Methanoregula sp.]